MKARIHSPTPRSLRRLAARLREGELVAIPTETVYGLAGNALVEKTCRAIFRAKGRPASDPLIVHVLDLAHAEELAVFNAAARKIVRRFWPGPLTIVLPRKPCVPGVVTAGGPTVALRSPSHPLARRLLRLSGVPLAAPSANPFSYISPTTAEHVRQGLGRRIPDILDGGPSSVGVESTVLDLTSPAKPRILRPGSIGAADLERVLGRKVASGAGRRRRAPLRAPGLLERHYSPRTPLQAGPARASDASSRVAVILLQKPAGKAPAHVYWLSRRGALKDIARNLYGVLRATDAAGYDSIRIETVAAGAGGLADAINDRIRRAAAKR